MVKTEWMHTKIRTKRGKIYEARLYGQRGGDLLGGAIFVPKKKKIYQLGHPTKNLPDKDFPIKATEPTPFVDFPYEGDKPMIRKKRRR